MHSISTLLKGRNWLDIWIEIDTYRQRYINGKLTLYDKLWYMVIVQCFNISKSEVTFESIAMCALPFGNVVTSVTTESKKTESSHNFGSRQLATILMCIWKNILFFCESRGEKPCNLDKVWTIWRNLNICSLHFCSLLPFVSKLSNNYENKLPQATPGTGLTETLR